MKGTVVIAVLPSGVAILIKIATRLLNRGLMRSSLEKLASLPKPRQAAFDLSAGQREVIIEHLSLATLKSTTLLTSLTSLFAACVIVIGNKGSTWMVLVLLLFLILGLGFLCYILPKQVYFFARPGWLDLTKATWVTLALGLYDVMLAALSVASVLGS